MGYRRRVPCRRLLPLAFLATLLVVGPAAGAPSLTTASSVAFRFASRSVESVDAVGCGTTATITKALPAGARRIALDEPAVGDRDAAGGSTRISAVAVTGTVVTIAVLADGPGLCDPAVVGGAIDQVRWSATYVVRALYSRRVRVPLRTDALAGRGSAVRLHPATVKSGTGPTGESYVGLRWSRFGGRKAVGIGTLRQNYCRAGDACPDNGRPIRLVASDPGYCPLTKRIEYREVTGYLRGHLFFGTGPGYCSA